MKAPPIQLERTARRALLRKEWRESRAAVIAGAAIFLGLPILWMSLYNVIAPQPELFPGLATTLMIVAGWLYAAVVAAQSVCRDLGRPQGEFLLARPIAPADAIRPKAAVGLWLVLTFVVAVGVWEIILFSLSEDTLPSDRFWMARLLGAGLAAVLAYWVAFAAAVVTRQMLSGVMMAGLILALVGAAPLLTSVPARAADATASYTERAELAYHAHGLGFIDEVIRGSVAVYIVEHVPGCTIDFRRSTFHHPCSLPTVTAAGIVLAIAVVRFLVTLVASRARAMGRPDAKRILALLGLFLLLDYAIQQSDLLILAGFVFVLAAARIARGLGARACCAQRMFTMGSKSAAWTVGLTLILLFTLAMTEVGGNLTVASTHWRRPTRAIDHLRLAVGTRRIAAAWWWDHLRVFELDETGSTVNEHRYILPFSTARTFPGADPVLVFDEGDRLFAVSARRPVRFAEDYTTTFTGPPHVALQPIGEEGMIGPAVEMPLPDTIPCDGWILCCDAAIEDERVFVLLQHQLGDGTPTVAALATYRLSPDGSGVLEHAMQVSASSWHYQPRSGGYRFGRGADGHVYAGCSSRPPIDPSDPDGGGQRGLGNNVGHYGFPSVRGRFVIGGSVRVHSDRTGLAVHDVPPPVAVRRLRWSQREFVFGREVVLGQVKASPWAYLFRSDRPILTHAGPGKVWEVHNDSAICYDVSDPSHPRRIAHVTTHRIRDAVAGPEFLVLDHGPGFSIVRHPE